MSDLVPLNCLDEGRGGAVVSVVGLRDAVHRLAELGIRTGAEVEMVRRGSPCIVRLAGHQLCLRADELLNVLVRPGVVA